MTRLLLGTSRFFFNGHVEDAMALYQNFGYFAQSQHQNFSKLNPPGTVVPDSGIYRCEGCGDEIAANKNQPLRPRIIISIHRNREASDGA